MWNCCKLESQCQKVVALSSTEAKYIAATDAIKGGIWLSGFLSCYTFSMIMKVFSS